VGDLHSALDPVRVGSFAFISEVLRGGRSHGPACTELTAARADHSPPVARDVAQCCEKLARSCEGDWEGRCPPGRRAALRLLGYDIVTERETADALLRADAYLSTQPTRVEDEKGQLRDILESGGGKSLNARARVGSSGRIRTGEDPPTPDDSDPLDPGHNAT